MRRRDKVYFITMDSVIKQLIKETRVRELGYPAPNSNSSDFSHVYSYLRDVDRA